jgi:hypothetical protein
MFSPRSTFPMRSRSPRRLLKWLAGLVPCAVLATSSLAFAQDEEEAAAEATEEPSETSEDATETSAEASTEAEAPREEISSPPDSKNRGSGIWEDPKQTYYFAGLRYRLQVMPKFVQNWFAEGGETLTVHTPGLEFGIRQDGFEYNIFGMLGMYNMTNVPFKGNTDVELAWETITANYKVLFLGSDFMWSTPELTQGLSVIYGAGIGLGLVFGDMQRTQAYPDGNGSYAPCAGQFNPRGDYCDNINDHYNGYVEPSWADGGSSPIVFPWIAGQVGLRYKAHKNFVARLEGGYAISSFFVGLGADYGL